MAVELSAHACAHPTATMGHRHMLAVHVDLLLYLCWMLDARYAESTICLQVNAYILCTYGRITSYTPHKVFC